MRTERYGRMTRDPERRRRRAQQGLSPEPLAVVVTRSGDVPFDIPLFAEPEARVVVFTPTDLDTSNCAAQVEVVRLDPGQLTMTTVWRRLTSDFGVRMLLCEGGPTVFGALLQEGLADELFLTLSPRLAGGGSEALITQGPALPDLLELTLRWALERKDSLYLRYAVNR
jgi:5-amino-6-(5-phosphoribosylamino)uracil reductase